jgi:uncharacterized protein (TIGR03089 family)
VTGPQTLSALLDLRLRRDAASPLVTFYDDATGERVEVSAATFANWVAKSANLLVDDFGVGPGDVARIALPVHWQSLVVVAACWAAGLVVDLVGSLSDPAIAFVAEGGPAEVRTTDVIALSLRPMGGRLSEPNTTVTDYAAEVLMHGDRFAGSPTADDLAFPNATHRDVVAAAELAASSKRLLLAPGADPALSAPLLTTAYLAPLAGGGSTVLCRHADEKALPRRLETERAELPNDPASRDDPSRA